MLCTRRNYTSTVPDLQDLCSTRLELGDVELNCLELDPQLQRLLLVCGLFPEGAAFLRRGMGMTGS